MRVDMRSGWEQLLRPDVEQFLDHTLGPDIAADARRLVPVLSGDLLRSIRHEVSGGELRVGSDLLYAGVVELGNRPDEEGRVRQSAQPWLRPALYRRRSG